MISINGHDYDAATLCREVIAWAGDAADDFDIDAIVDEWLDEIDAVLPEGLAAYEVGILNTGGVEYDEGAIAEAIEAIDLAAIAERHVGPR